MIEENPWPIEVLVDIFKVAFNRGTTKKVGSRISQVADSINVTLKASHKECSTPSSKHHTQGSAIRPLQD